MSSDRSIRPDADHLRDAGREARDIIRASAHFDPTARIYTLIHYLESSARSYHREVIDLRDALSRKEAP